MNNSTPGQSSVRIGAAYIRVSTDDQLEYSPESQIKLIQEYARKDGHIIPPEYIYQDGGISGRSAEKRPAFRLMIGQAKETTPPPFDTIYIWKYSRFARNQEEAIMYKNLLRKRSIEVRSISEPSSDSPYSSLIERIIEWMDEYYIINLATEVRRGMKEKATRGEALGRAPYGYKVENKQYVPDENAQTVRYIFALYASGIGYRNIAQDLITQGIRTATGKLPTTTMVEYILHNPAYIGKIRWSEEGRLHHRHPVSETEADTVVYVDGKHEPLIDIDTWNKVQQRLQTSYAETKYRQREDRIHMLKGVIRCGSCGATLIPQGKKTKEDKVRSLQCCNYARGTCNVSHSILISKAESMVIEALEAITETGTYTFIPQKETVSAPARDWEKLIASEKSKLTRARSAYLDGAFEIDEYRAIRGDIEATIQKLKESQKADGAESKIDIVGYKKKVLDIIDLLKKPEVDAQTKNEALRRIVARIEMNRPGITLDFFFIR